MSNSVDKHLYEGRKEFSIIALTGITGSGYKELIDIMQMPWDELKQIVRNPKDLYYTNSKEVGMEEINDDNKWDNYDAIAYLMNNRKYTICYNYMAEHYTHSYEVVKYNKVLWLYTLKYIKMHGGSTIATFKQKIQEILEDKYAPHRYSYEEERKTDDSYYQMCLERQRHQQSSYLDYWAKISNAISEETWQNVLTEISQLPNFIGRTSLKEAEKKKLNDIFFDPQSHFSRWYNNINATLIELDYYCSCFLYHRLGTCIRTTGKPTIKTQRSVKSFKTQISSQHKCLFDVVQLITSLIKNHHKQLNGQPCRICIDALHNSLEAKYLQERFTAFYFMTVNNTDYRGHMGKVITKRLCLGENSLYDKDNDADYIKEIIKYTLLLGSTEAKSGIKNGHLAVPDLENCVADAEILMSFVPTPNEIIVRNQNREHLIENKYIEPIGFYYLAEQWMKYACLIQHPGLITPSTDERCMEIAYTAKFNSGCISRQVGAVITNKFGSIRTIGWNDVPYGQAPCAARDIRDFFNDKEQNPTNQLRFMYSDFETETENKPDICLYSNKCFKEMLSSKYGQHIDAISQEDLRGLPFPFCFREHHTSWLTKEAGNQFHQRSIHAEENAMMQMVKFGGEALKGGIIYVTASPCEICSKKLYQIGVRKIVYIDPYPGIARKQIIASGYRRPELVNYQGAYGATYYKLFMPFMSYKDEICLRIADVI